MHTAIYAFREVGRVSGAQIHPKRLVTDILCEERFCMRERRRMGLDGTCIRGPMRRVIIESSLRWFDSEVKVRLRVDNPADLG